MKLKLQNRNYFMFEKRGDSIEGVITNRFEATTQYGQQTVLVLDTDGTDAGARCVGCNSNLALYLDQLTEGMSVRITYVADEKNAKTKHTYRVFDVEDLSSEDPND